MSSWWPRISVGRGPHGDWCVQIEGGLVVPGHDFALFTTELRRLADAADTLNGNTDARDAL